MEEWRKYLANVHQPVKDVALLIARNKGCGACIVDDEGVLRGIVTEADLKAKDLGGRRRFPLLEDVMNPYPKCLSATESEDDILDYMLMHNIRCLPLIDEDGVVKNIRYIDEQDIIWRMKTDTVKTAVLKGFTSGDMRYERIVFLGDELAGFCEWAEFIHYSEIKLYNRGVFGNTIRDIRNRIDSVLHLQPNKVFLMAGIHDFIRGRAVKSVFEDYAALALEIRKSGNARVYVQSLLPVHDNAAMNAGEENIVAFNSMLRVLSEAQRIPYIDLHSLICEKIDKYTVDGWHLNADGYKLWVSYADEYLRSEI